MISRFSRSFVAITVALLLLATIAFLHPPSRGYIDPWTGELFGEGGVEKDILLRPYPPAWADSSPGSEEGARERPAATPASASVHDSTSATGSEVVKGAVIMSKLANETAKAELGRATWKLLHTMTLRYPEKPTQDEREALEAYMYLTSRLYPCGECATEFQALLKKFPPQTASRLSASLWLCSVHNEVNARLGKPMFDCSKLDAEYDCGCGDATTSTAATDGRPKSGPSSHDADRMELMDLEWDVAKDDVTGVRMIKGGRMVI
ncbi:ERV/ALR sulfhydryl oxidase domain-containing protein [Boletus reticuloceps]|uniref:Sulfhydryl oxidase n=1 Tax=Boletus reticuloceps TaxID=495285 RepID=A0A8I2YYQ4_9AGAM|nr:ERV/ALR sulfhydryl oxidase domain-containing protein [Boletus reticuloceps]